MFREKHYYTFLISVHDVWQHIYLVKCISMYLKHLDFADRFARNSFKGVLLGILQGSNQHNKSSYSAGQLLNMEHYGGAKFGYFMQILLTYFKDTSKYLLPI